jgi:ssDNA-binding Zn-finger/Zn-ribbon topoisomerase 1
MTTAKTLPCGCIVDTVGDAFVMQPCSPDCEYYRYVLAESARQHKPLELMIDPEIPTSRCPRCGQETRVSKVNSFGIRMVGCLNKACA